MISVHTLLPVQTACAACRWRIPQEGPICRSCLSSLEPAPTLCPKCWSLHALEDRAQCQLAAFAKDSSFPPLFACFPAIGQAHEVLKAWKVAAEPALDRVVLPEAIRLNSSLKPWIQEIVRPNWIVPIPQLTDRRWVLGGGSTIRLARTFSRELEIPWLALLEKEHRNRTKRQAELGHQERMENDLHFRTDPSREEMTLKPGSGRRLLLVDDILTTGRTLSAAINTAQASGYQVTGALVLGWRPPIIAPGGVSQSTEVSGRSP